MFVKIGPYRSWIGPYQIADTLKIFGVSEDRCHTIGKWLADTWVGSFCNWVDKKKNRKIKVIIDKYDTWSMDSTLALIILPMLQQLKATMHGAGYVDDEDVPEELRSTNAPPKENEWDIDGNHFKRFDYVLDEMIFAFEAKNSNWEHQFHTGNIDIEWIEKDNNLSEMTKGVNDTHQFDKDGFTIFHNRMANGFRLFGKYYENLWT